MANQRTIQQLIRFKKILRRFLPVMMIMIMKKKRRTIIIMFLRKNTLIILVRMRRTIKAAMGLNELRY